MSDNKAQQENSCAYQAYQFQGRDGGNPENIYSGHDNLQNGFIPHGQDTTFYVAEWDKGDKIDSSGFFTDQATIDSCIHDGKLDANKLGRKCQTKPSNWKGTDENNNNLYYDDYWQRTNVNAYHINWDALDNLKTSTNEDDREIRRLVLYAQKMRKKPDFVHI